MNVYRNARKRIGGVFGWGGIFFLNLFYLSIYSFIYFCLVLTIHGK